MSKENPVEKPVEIEIDLPKEAPEAPSPGSVPEPEHKRRPTVPPDRYINEVEIVRDRFDIEKL